MGMLGDYFKSPFKMADSFLNPEKGYDKAMDEWKRAYEESKQYGQPFWEAGKGQIPWLNNARDQLFDPGKLQGEWAKGYEMSPEAQDMMNRMREYGGSEASSMGLQGSSAALENSQRTAGSIVSQDRQRYMNDLMQKYLASIGIGQNMYGVGANMGAQMGQNAMNFGNNQAGLAYGKQQAPGQQLGQLIGAGAGLYGGGMGGGMGRSPGTGVY